MRIAITNWSRRRVGGVETYLDAVVPELHRHGHEVAFLCEVDVPARNERITVPEGSPTWCASSLGHDGAIAELRNWKPDLIYSHGFSDPLFEARIAALTPTIFWAHNYYGTCISGNKSFRRPVVKPCSRRFGLKCLLHYYPHRCGGLNPATMWKEYNRQRARLRLLHKFRGIVVASEHMREEYLRHEILPSRVHVIPYPVRTCRVRNEAACYHNSNGLNSGARRRHIETELSETGHRREVEQGGPWRLLFVGRMTSLKGGLLLLESLPRVSRSLQRPLHLVLAGDGPDRVLWEKHATGIEAANPAVKVEFVGWINGERLQNLFRESDLLVVPSVWPEPFGLVGPEAGLHGVPAVAFRVGGIPEWLIDGVNGYLVLGDAPNADDLAATIIKYLRSSADHPLLREGAMKVAREFSMQRHLGRLLPILESAVAGRDVRALETAQSLSIQAAHD
jgi:glycosyltransferase involved in cell wall biosynthesis